MNTAVTGVNHRMHVRINAFLSETWTADNSIATVKLFLNYPDTRSTAS
jgi:hypothetical protein